jgi:hypothetical protein
MTKHTSEEIDKVALAIRNECSISELAHINESPQADNWRQVARVAIAEYESLYEVTQERWEVRETGSIFVCQPDSQEAAHSTAKALGSPFYPVRITTKRKKK